MLFLDIVDGQRRDRARRTYPKSRALRVSPFFHEVFYLQRWMFRFHDKNAFENYLAHFLCLFQQRVSSFFHVPFQRWDPYCLQMNVLGLQQVALFYLKNWVLREKN